MFVISNSFPKLETEKNLARPLCKKSHFRTPFDSQHVKVFETRIKSPKEYIDQIISWLFKKLISKIPPLAICEILGMFFNTLTPGVKYPVQNYENLLSPIQMQLT